MSKWKVNIKRPFFDDNIKKIIYDILCLLLFLWYREIAFTSLSFRCHLRFLLELTLNHIKFNAYVCNVYCVYVHYVGCDFEYECVCVYLVCMRICLYDGTCRLHIIDNLVLLTQYKSHSTLIFLLFLLWCSFVRVHSVSFSFLFSLVLPL